jgi:hypothetical protein
LSTRPDHRRHWRTAPAREAPHVHTASPQAPAADAYELSPAPKSLLIVQDGEHTLGGIAGESVSETTDTDPARVALVADAVAAYLLEALNIDTNVWSKFSDEGASEHKASLTHKG